MVRGAQHPRWRSAVRRVWRRGQGRRHGRRCGRSPTSHGEGAGGTEAFSAGRSLSCSGTQGLVKNFNPDSLSRKLSCRVRRAGPSGSVPRKHVWLSWGCSPWHRSQPLPINFPCEAGPSTQVGRGAGAVRGAARQNGRRHGPQESALAELRTRGN